MKWPCGPLEVARLKRLNTTENDLLQMAEAWARPAALRCLEGTAINCLILDWASGIDDDHAQQLALKPLIEAGRSHGISFIARIEADANVSENVTTASRAGFEAVLLGTAPKQSVELPFILQFASDHIPWETTTAIFCTTGNVWPQANLKNMDENMDGDTAIAGPTANPWTESNGWLSLLAHQMAPGKTLWLEIDPPETMETRSSQDYCLALADARVYGARWIISLDATVRAGLSRGDATAIAMWTRICETLDACESHPGWEEFDPMGILAVASDFRGSNAFTGGQLLNLLNRRQLQFTIVDRTLPFPRLGEWVRGVLWVDEQPPTSEQRAELLTFAHNGGVVITPQYWGPAGANAYKQDWLFGYALYAIGAGRMVVAEDGLPEPYQLSRDAHLLVSRKNDFVRLYNPGTTRYYSSINSLRRSQLVRILNYSGESASYVTLWVDTSARSARLWIPSSEAPLALKSTNSGDGVSFDLPPFSVLCAVEIERSV
jgi:hypothetical protein